MKKTNGFDEQEFRRRAAIYQYVEACSFLDTAAGKLAYAMATGDPPPGLRSLIKRSIKRIESIRLALINFRPGKGKGA